ncbi:MAG TPA: hypothetical protein VM364_23295 [Vicinamibacterales bacterium]|nr:hypothetical protein [Vicinamibacterales bacterium]
MDIRRSDRILQGRGLPFVMVVAVLALCVGGCGSDLRVTSIQLGRSLNADNTVASHTTTFGPSDTVYLSVLTAGGGSGTIRVRWSYGERVVGEPEQRVSYRGAAVTEFHLQNAGGFPPGDYKAEVFLNGQPAGERTFRVERER